MIPGAVRPMLRGLHSPPSALRPAPICVIGSGPNGLAAALTLAEAGHRVTVVEKNAGLGGGARSWRDEHGVLHDHCSAIQPLAVSSPFFRRWRAELAEAGLAWRFGELEVAHPLPAGMGGAVAQARALDSIDDQLPAGDARAWRRHFAPLLERAEHLFDGLLAPLPPPRRSWPALLRFGPNGIRSARRFARERFRSERARALFAGHAAHSIQPLGAPATAGFGTMLALSAHAVGWPLAVGGSQAIADALATLCRRRGVEFETGREVRSLADLPADASLYFDTGPRALARIAGDALPSRYRARLNRFRYGPGVFKLDLVLSETVPWRDEACTKAPTVHLGGTLDEITESEQRCWNGRTPEQPFVLVAQQSRFDESRRGPRDEHNLWAYCHVPHGWDGDATEAILAQIERAAPGFRDTIRAIHRINPGQFHADNPNLVGGDITGGVQDLLQQYARPVLARDPYATPNPRIRICSASTPPGGGVHGMCGWWASQG